MRAYRPALILALLACGAAGYGQPPAERASRALLRADRQVLRADRALRLGNLGRAEESFRRALKLLPDLPEGHLGLGHVLLQRRHFDAALEHYRRAERGYRERRASLLALHTRRYEESRARFSDLDRRRSILQENIERMESLRQDSTGRSAIRQEGLLRSLREEVRRLEEETRRLESILPPPRPGEDGVPAEVFFFLGNAQLHLGRLAEAVRSWSACVERDPDFGPVYHNLAAAHWRLGQPELAWGYLEAARERGLEVHPELRRAILRALERPPQRQDEATPRGGPED